MTSKAVNTVTEPDTEIPLNPEQQTFTCDRCGYRYQKQFDHLPYLCNRCMRFIAKKVWTAVHTIQPATSAPALKDD